MEVGTILWAKNRPSDHNDHLHTEPKTRKSGTPPLTNPGMTPGVRATYDALVVEFGPGAYFLDSKGRYVGNDPGIGWTHMGGWNRRKIAGSQTWSQHAWWNAIDIGPYVGVKAQQRFYDFLTGVTIPPIGDDPMWQYLNIDESLVRHAWGQGWLQPKTQATLDYFLSILPELQKSVSANPDWLNFRRAVSNGIARATSAIAIPTHDHPHSHQVTGTAK